jgi:hypothetical protein
MAAAAASLVSLPLLSAIFGAAIALLFLSGYLRRKRAAIAHLPPSATAAAPDQPKQVRPSNQNQPKKGHQRSHHAVDKDAAKKHHHLDVNTLRGHTDSVTALHFSDDACNLATGQLFSALLSQHHITTRQDLSCFVSCLSYFLILYHASCFVVSHC